MARSKRRRGLGRTPHQTAFAAAARYCARAHKSARSRCMRQAIKHFNGR